MKLVFSYKYAKLSIFTDLLFIDHLQKPQKLHTTKISAHMVRVMLA